MVGVDNERYATVFGHLSEVVSLQCSQLAIRSLELHGNHHASNNSHDIRDPSLLVCTSMYLPEVAIELGHLEHFALKP